MRPRWRIQSSSARPEFRVLIGPRRARARDVARDLFRRERQVMSVCMRQTESEIIHAMWTYEFAWAALDTRRPVLVTAHDAPLTVLRELRDPYRAVRAAMAYLVRTRIRNLTAVSPHLAQRWRREMLYHRPIAVIPNVAPRLLQESDTRHSTTRPALLDISDAGRLKNVGALVEAFAHLRAEGRDLTLNLVGPGLGSDSPLARRLLAQGLGDGIEYHGVLSRHSLATVMARSALFVHPSREEACPMSMLEAMDAGLPVVGGIRSGGVRGSLTTVMQACSWTSSTHSRSLLRSASCSTTKTPQGTSPTVAEARKRLLRPRGRRAGIRRRLRRRASTPFETLAVSSLTRSALAGVAWNYAGATLVVTQIASTAVTARIVSPRQFGAYATAQAAAGILGYFTLSAVGNGLLRRSELLPGAIGTATVISVIGGAIAAVTMWLLADPWATAWHVPAAARVVHVMAVTILLTSGATIPLALLRRRLRFRATAMAETGTQVLGAAVGVGLAIRLHSAFTLAAGQTTAAAVLLAISASLAFRDLELRFSRREARELLGFAGQVRAINFGSYLMNTAPSWYTARIFGTRTLGVYSRASVIVALPLTYLASGLTKVLYPLYGLVRGDQARTRAMLDEGITMATGFAWPVFALIAGAAPVIVKVLLGPGWEGTASLPGPLRTGCLCRFAVRTSYECRRGVRLDAHDLGPTARVLRASRRRHRRRPPIRLGSKRARRRSGDCPMAHLRLHDACVRAPRLPQRKDNCGKSRCPHGRLDRRSRRCGPCAYGLRSAPLVAQVGRDCRRAPRVWGALHRAGLVSGGTSPRAQAREDAAGLQPRWSRRPGIATVVLRRFPVVRSGCSWLRMSTAQGPSMGFDRRIRRWRCVEKSSRSTL